jgi:glycosidase
MHVDEVSVLLSQRDPSTLAVESKLLEPEHNYRKGCQRMKRMQINRREAGLALLAAGTSISLPGCGSSPSQSAPASQTAPTPPTVTTTADPTAPGVAHVAWSQQTNIYEVNVRQFTPEGTFTAFAAHLPRLAQMGVGILWFMPIQPIGVKDRKGGLGSYYSISNYTAVNPEFGSLADFKAVVAQAHALGMKVILDWVANHTAWDHPWATANKSRYLLNERGDVFSVTFGSGATAEYWTDVVGLNYLGPNAQQDLWPAMTEAMLFWLRQTDIDGFRCDVASMLPTPFWEQARVQLERIKPVFMLAESDKADLHAKAFDMTYDWDLFDRLREIAKGQAKASALPAWWQRRQKNYPANAYRMNFTANHDSNSWQGSCLENYGSGEGLKTMAVVAALLPGMPLIYGGQEAFFEKRLQFFDRDPITWRGYPLAAFYTELLQLKKTHPALSNDAPPGTLEFSDAGNPNVVFFTRVRGAKKVSLLANLSAQTQICQIANGAPKTLAPWAYEINLA